MYFPRLIIPLSDCLSGSLDFAISLVLLIGLMVWYDVATTWHLLLQPFAFVAFMTALGASNVDVHGVGELQLGIY